MDFNLKPKQRTAKERLSKPQQSRAERPNQTARLKTEQLTAPCAGHFHAHALSADERRAARFGS